MLCCLITESSIESGKTASAALGLFLCMRVQGGDWEALE